MSNVCSDLNLRILDQQTDEVCILSYDLSQTCGVFFNKNGK